jgi:dihydroxyacetone kinase-like predicted kinase
VHVHTDEPERAVSLGQARGVVEALEVADMHEQIVARTHRLEQAACAVVAVADGAGNRELFESLGAIAVDGATSPSPRELLAVIESGDAREAILLRTTATRSSPPSTPPSTRRSPYACCRRARSRPACPHSWRSTPR